MLSTALLIVASFGLVITALCMVASSNNGGTSRPVFVVFGFFAVAVFVTGFFANAEQANNTAARAGAQSVKVSA